jgi:3-hydroxybutyrate dehydrogenase
MSFLTGRTALITGSTQGLGLAAARALAAAGCHLVLNGLADRGVVDTLRRDIEDTHGVRTAFDPADLRDPVQIARMVAGAATSFGSVDILVNNAVARHTAPVDQFPVESWNDAVAVNLSAAFHAIRATLPSMRHNRWGRIVNVSSIYGLKGAVNRVAYVTTKTALIGLTRAVALETAHDGITCNAVCPGTAETPVHDAAIRASMASAGTSRADAERQFLASKQPTGRFIAAEGVAALIVFLCSAEAGDITGAVLPIDGAWSAA